MRKMRSAGVLGLTNQYLLGVWICLGAYRQGIFHLELYFDLKILVINDFRCEGDVVLVWRSTHRR
ncbi:MAG: hypothetical protein AAFQ58_20015 [Pseudomonadota bacterium]